MNTQKKTLQKKGASLASCFLKPSFASSFSLLSFSLLALSLGACSSSPQTTEASTPVESIESADESSVAPELLGDTETDTLAAGSTETNTQNFSGGSDPLFGRRQAPVVADKPFEKEGRWMNAYYFVRSTSETWETLSTLIYGRPDRADLLMSWNVTNSAPLRVGKVIYYNSALRPDDNENIKVFSDDFGLAFEQVEVQRGDSLSLIGQRTFGDAQTWREIASLNPEIANPDIIQPGQKIKLQAAVLDTKPVFEQLLAQAQSKQQEQAPQNSQPIDQNTSDQNTQIAQIDNSATHIAEIPQTDNSEAPVLDNTVNAESSPSNKMSIVIKLAISIILIALVAFILKRRIAAKKALNQSWENQASVMTKISG